MNKSDELMERADKCFKRLRLTAMMPKLKEMLDDTENLKKSQLEWIVELHESEMNRREENALKEKLRKAKLRYSSADESAIVYDPARNLDSSLIGTLTTCEWIRRHQNCLITGKVGTGKTFIAGCLAIAACRLGINSREMRMPLLLQEVADSHGISGEYRVELRALKKVELLLLDDWGLGSLDSDARSDLLEIVEARHGCGSTIITSVLPVSAWASWIGDATYSDAILDRLTANSIRIELKGESMRAKRPEEVNNKD